MRAVLLTKELWRTETELLVPVENFFLDKFLYLDLYTSPLNSTESMLGLGQGLGLGLTLLNLCLG